jgi:hypothetical protein
LGAPIKCGKEESYALPFAEIISGKGLLLYKTHKEKIVNKNCSMALWHFVYYHLPICGYKVAANSVRIIIHFWLEDISIQIHLAHSPV